jgi:5'-deoxynucleotidase YfbR-like HD superfamily hydrolase
LHPLQSERQILIVAIRDLLDLSDEYGGKLPYLSEYHAKRESLVMEATRLALRLQRIQYEIEEQDLD